MCDKPHFNRVFCLVHAEKLPYHIADSILRSLNKIIQAKTGGTYVHMYINCGLVMLVNAFYCLLNICTGYRLVIICSNQDKKKSHIISKLDLYHRSYVVPSQITKYQQYLRQHFIKLDRQTRAGHLPVMALGVDHER